MKTITLDRVMKWRPCYDRARVEMKFDGRKKLTARDVINLDLVFDDTIWVLANMMSKKKARQFAHDVSARAIKRRVAFDKKGRKKALELLRKAESLLNSSLHSTKVVELNDEIYREASCAGSTSSSQALWALDDATDSDSEGNNAWSSAIHSATSCAYTKGNRANPAFVHALNKERKFILRMALEYL